MSLKAEFGNGGRAAPYEVAGSFTNNVTAVGGSLTAPEYIVVSKVAKGGEVEGTGSGGTVKFTNNGSNEFTLEAGTGTGNNFVTGWNTVKNVDIKSETNQTVTLKNFVQADVNLVNGGGSKVTIENAKRGDIVTGNGDDTINIEVLSNGAGWSNTFTVNTNGGVDRITFDEGRPVGNGSFTEDGKQTTVIINAGDGGDTIDLEFISVKSALITGGTGADTIYLGDGKETLIYAQGDGVDTVYNFDKTADKIDVSSIAQYYAVAVNNTNDAYIGIYDKGTDLTSNTDDTLVMKLYDLTDASGISFI
jgi:hypothetical protein